MLKNESIIEKKNINYAITSRQLFDKYVNEIREKEIK